MPHADLLAAVQSAALDAVEPCAAVHRHLKRSGDRLTLGGETFDLRDYERLWVVGGGKAAPAMVTALNELLGDRLIGGVVVTKYGHTGHTSTGITAPATARAGSVTIVEGGHPLPDAAGSGGARLMLDLLGKTASRDLVLAVISGGASALLTLPAESISLADLQETTDLLLRIGATVVELNTVRKHLSLIKGGGLAREAAPATVVCLVLSDVVGDPLDVIGSGPTVPDPSTFADAWSVLERYDLAARVPAAVRERLRAGCAGRIQETPKPGSDAFQRVHNMVVGSNRLAAEAAITAASIRAFNTLLLSTYVEGEARHVARVAAAIAKEVLSYNRPVPRPACLVWGGETTVTVVGDGLGGRNQELALAAAIALDGLPNVLLVALGTDGTDGPTDAAGAVATGETVARARALGLDPDQHLADNNAYPFFDKLDDLIRTGPTGTNVNDLLLLFVF
jgi:hydroxypyruvate reductase